MKIEGLNTIITGTGGKTLLTVDDTINIEEVFFAIEDPDDNGTVGWSDITTKYSRNALYNETTTSYAIRHYKNIGGTKTLVLSLNVTATGFDEPGELGLTVDTCTASTKLYVLVKGT